MLQHPVFRGASLLLFALILTATSAQGMDIKDTVKKTFKVRPGGTLFVEMDAGNIGVTTHGGREVHVEVVRSASVSDPDRARKVFSRHNLLLESRGQDVVIESRFDRESGFLGLSGGRDRIEVRVEVKVPRHYHVEFTSGAGNVEIGNLDGRIEGSTGAGNINIGVVTGPVNVNSGSGNINLEGAGQVVEANTGAGNIKLRNIKGPVDINTGAGNITAYITEQPGDGLHLSSGAGNVTAYVGKNVGVSVEAQASLGSAKTDFALAVEGKWMSKSFQGEVNGGGPRLHLQSGVGNVELKKL